MKKIAVFLIAALIFTLMPAASRAADSDTEVSIYFEGKKVEFTDAKPIHTGTRVLVPVRGFFERIGVTVDWNEFYDIVIVKDDSREIMLEVGNNAVLNNGVIQYLDCSVQIRGNRAYIPLRYISESFGCRVVWDGKTKSVYITREQENAEGQDEAKSVLPKVNDLESLYNLLKYNGNMASYVGFDYADVINQRFTQSDFLANSAAPSPSVQYESAADSAAAGPSYGHDHSQTNIQVTGVEEGDLIKTDGEYLYIARDSDLFIVNASPDKLEIVSKIPCNGEISELYIHGDRLIIINGDSCFEYIPEGEKEKKLYNMLFGGINVHSTNVKVFDISDKTVPVLFSDKEYEGNYVSSRMIDDDLYLVTNARIQLFSAYNMDDEVIEMICRNDKEAFLEMLAEYEEDEERILRETGYRTIGELFDAARAAVELNIAPKIKDGKTGRISLVDPGEISYFRDMVRPSYMLTVGLDLSSGNEDINVYLGSSGIMYASENYLYTTLAAYEYNVLKSKLYNRPSYDLFTTVYRFEVKDGKIRYDMNGKVPGQLLNQFSLDEYNGFLRIATTTGRSASDSENNVYALDSKMNITGRLEGIAKGERIYSTRFAGERIYMVTFRQTDPFFVIDASDPRKMNVLGYLKIPGFSTYLHILDNDHVLGFGYETDDNSWSGTGGFKISLFDVSDVTKPVEVKKEVIGKRAQSQLEYDHKALMISLKKGIMGFPIIYYNTDSDYFAGFYLYNITNDDFSFRGRVTHVPDNTSMNDVVEEDLIYRGVYIEDNLYTVSQSKLQVNDLDTFKVKGSVKLR